jgi:aspartyl-tRNA(Asn)/glutamyl-tRNA(Gln) amidotransferase subunit A
LLNFNEFDLVGIAQAIRAKQISAYELAQESIRRLQTLGRQFNAVFLIDEESALARATLLDQKQEKNEPLGLLHGVPLGHKDLIAVANRRMHVGSTVLANNISAVNSLVNERLENAGQVNVASLHMAEFALSPTGFNQHYGHGQNPWNPLYAPGGSSSGSGIAVALRLLFGSIGSDTGGSIRHPSAMCGITGLKPTNGLVPANGVFPLSTSLDCVGPMAQSVRDCARLLTVVTGQSINYESNLQLPISGIKIGIPKTYFYENLDPSVENCLLEVMATFTSLKLELVEVGVPNMQKINQNMGIVLAYEAYQLHQKWLQEFPLDYAEQVKARIEIGKDLTFTAYEQALHERSIVNQAVQSDWFSHCDAILVPTLQIQTPSIEATTKGSTAEILSNLMRVTQNTKGINYLSLPALSMPIGFTRDGLPIGMQLIGNQLSEERLLQIGYAFQNATNWHREIPSKALEKY